MLRQASRPLALRNDRTGLLVATVLELAADSESRNRGLLGRDSLAPENALILAPASLVHTFFMRFPIDVLFVSRDGRVLKAKHAVPARRVTGSVRAFAVIEFAAGRVDESQTLVGDHLSIVPA